MSLKYRDSQGTETPVAGLNGTSGELVPSVALQQSGRTETLTCEAFSYASTQITFATPMPDANYVIVYNADNLVSFASCSARNKTAQGFTLYVYNANNSALSGNVSWTAFKLMTDIVHEADSAHIAQNTANFAPAFSDVVSYAVGDYVTYNNVLYRCTTAHTAGVWVAGHFTQVTVGGDLARNSIWHYKTVTPSAGVPATVSVPSSYNGFYEVSVFDAMKHIFHSGVRLGTDVTIGTVATNYAGINNDGIQLYDNRIQCARQESSGGYIVAYRPIQAVAID